MPEAQMITKMFVDMMNLHVENSKTLGEMTSKIGNIEDALVKVVVRQNDAEKDIQELKGKVREAKGFSYAVSLLITLLGLGWVKNLLSGH